jgi:hypothetical protein
MTAASTASCTAIFTDAYARDAYARVQVKGRSVHPYPGIEIKVPVDEMADDRATLVAVDVHFAETALAGHALVIDVPTFRELAHREVHRSDVSYRAEVDLSAPHTRWAP